MNLRCWKIGIEVVAVKGGTKPDGYKEETLIDVLVNGRREVIVVEDVDAVSFGIATGSYFIYIRNLDTKSESTVRIAHRGNMYEGSATHSNVLEAIKQATTTALKSVQKAYDPNPGPNISQQRR